MDQLQLLENPIDAKMDRLELLENPVGAEMMILNPAQDLFENPTRRRRRGRPRRRTRTRVRIRIPKRNAVANPHRRRRRRRGRKRLVRHSRPGRRRARSNPVAARGETFRLAELPRYMISGSLGAFSGSGGYYLSKMLLPPEYDRHLLGYAAHGGLGTGLAIGVGMLGKAIGVRLSLPAMIGAAWGTVAFRILLNTWFSKIPRPGAAISASPAVTAKGLAGIEEALPASYDVGDMDDEHDMAEMAQVSRRFIGQLTPDQVYEEEVAGTQGVDQAYQTPEPYDVGQEYQPPEPYDVGQEYQPARALPAASMPVGQPPMHQEAPELGQEYQSPEPYDVGAYSKKAPSQWAPMW